MTGLFKEMYFKIWHGNGTYFELSKDEWILASQEFKNKIRILSIELSDGDFVWFSNGNHITNQVYAWFKEMGWNHQDGLDTDDKKMLFRLKFC